MDSDSHNQLRVKVVEAKDLSGGLCDPYCIVTLEKNQVKTKVIKKTLNPVWDEEFLFDITTESTVTI
jgi:Ca2+-dependent lipid-binding protein